MPKAEGNEMIIPLSPNALHNPLKADLRIMMAYMLWPRDGVWRQRWIADWIVNNVETIKNERPELAAEYFSFAKAALPSKMIADEIAKKNIVRDATLAASVFMDHLYCRVSGSKITKGKITETAIKIRDNKTNVKGKKASIEVHTFDNKIWKTYSSVAHLWAAKYLANRDHGQSKYPPCSEDYLPQFLADAEGFRFLGEKTEMLRTSGRGTSRTVLNPKDTYKLPPWIEIEPSDLSVGQLRDEVGH